MLLVQASKGPSQIHGMGLFAGQFIPCGTIVWHLVPSFDRLITPSVLAKLSKVARDQVRFYAYQDPELSCFVLSSDDDRFTNHSDNPNTGTGPGMTTVALRDIGMGEEITWSYRGFGEVPEVKEMPVCGQAPESGWDVFM